MLSKRLSERRCQTVLRIKILRVAALMHPGRFPRSPTSRINNSVKQRERNKLNIQQALLPRLTGVTIRM